MIENFTLQQNYIHVYKKENPWFTQKMKSCMPQTSFPASEKLTFLWHPDSRGCVHVWYPNRHQHTQSVCVRLHSSRWKHVSTILSSAFTSAAWVKIDVITLSKVEVSAALGETKERPGETKWEGCTVFFYRLAVDGTPGVFIPRRWLISAACKSTWQVFTGAVNPTDSIHLANCSDAASLSRKDQTLAVCSPRSFVLSSWWKAKFTLCYVEMKGVMKPPWQSDYSCKHVCASLFAAHSSNAICRRKICCAGGLCYVL